jgi:hypothetical protein
LGIVTIIARPLENPVQTYSFSSTLPASFGLAVSDGSGPVAITIEDPKKTTSGSEVGDERK